MNAPAGRARHRDPDGARAARGPVAARIVALWVCVILLPAAAVGAAALTAGDGRQPTGEAPPTVSQPAPTTSTSAVRLPTTRAPASTTAAPSAPRSSTESRACRCAPRSPAASPTTRTRSSTVPSSAAAESPSPTSPQPEPVKPQPAAAVGLLQLVNRDRLANGCGPVTVHPSLLSQSQTHAEAEAQRDAVYHSGGPAGFGTWGENVAAGPRTAADVHDAWMHSPGHRANILNCSYTYIGFGAADSATDVRFWTEQLAA